MYRVRGPRLICRCSWRTLSSEGLQCLPNALARLQQISAASGYKWLASALYQPDSILRDRVRVDVLSSFAKAVEGVCQAYFDGVTRPELLDIAIIMRPGNGA